MRRDRSRRFGFAGAIFVLLMLVPPALRLAERSGALDAWFRVDRLNHEDHETELASARARAAVLEEALRVARAELDSLARSSGVLVETTSTTSFGARYRIVATDLVDFVDPSVGRHVLWSSAHGVPTLEHEGAAVVGDTLVGRVGRGLVDVSLLRVQTLLDPLFRVRFRAGEARGVLWGTGRHCEDGRPILEVHHPVDCEGLEEGTPVVSAGGDGVFPQGFYIGEVTEVDLEGGRPTAVRAALSPDSLERLNLVFDRVADDRAKLSRNANTRAGTSRR